MLSAGLPASSGQTRGRAATAGNGAPPKKKGKAADDKDKGKGEAEGEGGGARRPRRKVAKPVEGQAVILKALLQLFQTCRSLSGAVFDTIIVASDSPPAIKMAEQGRLYAEGAKEGKMEWPPHIYIFAGMMEGLIEAGEKIGAVNLKELQKFYTEQFVPLPEEDRCEMLSVVRCDKTYHGDKKRIVLAIERCEARRFILSGLSQLGGIRKFGRAPRGGLEREVEEFLKAMTSD